MIKFILIKSPDEWATMKQACMDELVVYLLFFLPYIARSTSVYCTLLQCIEHCFTNIKFYTSSLRWLCCQHGCPSVEVVITPDSLWGDVGSNRAQGNPLQTLLLIQLYICIYIYIFKNDTIFKQWFP